MTIKHGQLPNAQKVKNQTITMGTVVFNPRAELAKENKNYTAQNDIDKLQKAIRNSAFKEYGSSTE